MESTISAAPQISIDREKTLRSHRRYWVLRRAQDIVFSLLALILLAPLALLISLAIVLDSPGDGAIFRQRRVGRDGKLFWLYKFRTMCPDAEEQLNELLSQNQGIRHAPFFTFFIHSLTQRFLRSVGSGMIYTFSSLLLKLLFACTICHRSFIFVSYVSDGVENNGFEPLTLCVQGRCSSQLS